MKNNITKGLCALAILLGGFFTATMAQSLQEDSLTEEYASQEELASRLFAPQKGEMMFSLRFGKAIEYADLQYGEINQYNQAVTVIGQPYAVTDRYTDANLDNNGNLKVNNIGLEFKYFITPQIAARVGGSGMISSSPSQDYIEGVYDDSKPFVTGLDVSSYEDIEGETRMQFNFDLGADYYFNTKLERLFPYAGAEFNFLYARAEYATGYEGLDPVTGGVILSAGPRLGEVYGLGASAVAGLDYYITEGVFLGFEVKAASYMYNAKRIFFQEGTEAYDANTYNTTICDQFTFKLGVKF